MTRQQQQPREPSTSSSSQDPEEGAPPSKKVEFAGDDHSQSSYGDVSEHTHPEDAARMNAEAAAAKEMRDLLVTRIIVGLVMMALGGGFAVLAYFVVEKRAEGDFEEQVSCQYMYYY